MTSTRKLLSAPFFPKETVVSTGALSLLGSRRKGLIAFVLDPIVGVFMRVSVSGVFSGHTGVMGNMFLVVAWMVVFDAYVPPMWLSRWVLLTHKRDWSFPQFPFGPSCPSSLHAHILLMIGFVGSFSSNVVSFSFPYPFLLVFHFIPFSSASYSLLLLVISISKIRPQLLFCSLLFIARTPLLCFFRQKKRKNRSA